MKIIGARLKGQTDTITLPRMASVKSENFTKSKIISLIDKNQEDEFIINSDILGNPEFPVVPLFTLILFVK